MEWFVVDFFKEAEMKTKSEIKDLKELEKLDGKVKFTHLRHGMIGVGEEHSIAVVKIKDKHYYGSSHCVDGDTFSKKLGRELSLGRALKEYHDGKPTPLKDIPEDCWIKEDKGEKMEKGFKPSIKVVVRNESGYKEALMGISFNKDQAKDMTVVANKLAAHDYGHNKFLESIFIWVEVTAPRYWWQEADTFRISTKQSQSTMHTILRGKLTHKNFETHLPFEYMNMLNDFLKQKDLLTLKSLLPEGFLQKRMWVMSYKTFRNIVIQRKNHRLPHWKLFLDSVISQLKNPELLESVIDWKVAQRRK